MTCVEFLSRVRNVASTPTVPCLCTDECGRYWRLQPRTWWSRMAWWRTTVDCAGDWDQVWVRLSAFASAQVRAAEHQELLAADMWERS